ncbi:MAG TPA: alginate export family protein [Verrucomicrobiae bacterium]|nr:alginate export family protein [Verrucomicrobiae bacterium]
MKTRLIAAATAILSMLLTVAQAQTPVVSNVVKASGNEQPAIKEKSVDDYIKDLKNPTDWFSWGADFRVRNEYFNNALSLTSDPRLSPLFAPVHEQDYFRFRGRIWASFMPVENLSLNLRLAAEPREFMKPATMDTYFDHLGMQWRYGIIDNLNVQWKKPFDLPATLTVGRQDIFLGDGWLVGDGTPEDGSFTYFLDSARLTYDLKEQHTTVDVIGIVQYARPDAWLPTLGHSGSVPGDPEGLLLTDQDEKGAILWVANKSLPEANLDGYFIYKHDNRLDHLPAATFGDSGDLYTFGSRLSGLLADHWKYSAEGAYQFGQKEDPELNMGGSNPVLSPSAETTDSRNIHAFGVNSKLSYLFKDPHNNQLSLSYEFLSGDNPKTRDDEMFDVLWGRWPSWSEMYNIYSYVPETRVGQTANLHRFGPTWSLSPVKNMDFSVSYFALLADQDTPTRPLNQAFGLPASDTPFSNDGNFRGHYLQAVLKYKFNKYVSAHLWSEFLWEGNYYAHRDMMDFLRAEVMFTF